MVPTPQRSQGGGTELPWTDTGRDAGKGQERPCVVFDLRLNVSMVNLTCQVNRIKGWPCAGKVLFGGIVESVLKRDAHLDP